jgi:hypothetical protein
MKKFVIPALVLAAASVAVPAAAQSYRGPAHPGPALQVQVYHGPAYSNPAFGPARGPARGPAPQALRHWESISERKFTLDRRISRGFQDRSLSRREAGRLLAELDSLVRLERLYMRGGLSRAERRELDFRYDRLAAQIRSERRDRDNRRY